MGGSFSCICDPSSQTRNILVIKADGQVAMFKEGIRVEDVLTVYTCHKLIRCCSARTVLPDHFQLRCNQLYLLLPPTLILNDDSYKSILRLAASRSPKVSCSILQLNRGDHGNLSRKSSSKRDDADRWKPALQTVPEVNSLHSFAATNAN